MIFAVSNHIQQIIEGTKTQTRRVYHPEKSREYEVGKTYSIQPGRMKPGIARAAEGGYTPEEYEELFKKMHPNWGYRQALEFEFVPTYQKKEI